MSDSWPVKVWVALPLRISQSLADASQAPETKVFMFGARERLCKAVKRHDQDDKLASVPHHITRMVAEFDDTGTCLDIPEHAGHVTR